MKLKIMFPKNNSDLFMILENSKCLKKVLLVSCFLAMVDVMISQTWDWTRTANSEGQEGTGICIDNVGNIVICGRSEAGLLKVDNYTLTTNNISGYDSYVIKYSPSGTVLWAKTFEGGPQQVPVDIATDNFGNIFLYGYLNSKAIFGIDTLMSSGIADCFLVKFDPSGNVLWAKSSSNKGKCTPNSLTVNKYGQAFITGIFDSTSISFGNQTLTQNIALAPNKSSYFVKYSTAGNVIWAKQPIGAFVNQTAICADASGGIVAAGLYSNGQAICGVDTLPYLNGTNKPILIKYDVAGNALWGKTLPGNTNSLFKDISVDANDNIYVGGNFYGGILSAGQSTISGFGGADALIAKFDLNGKCQWLRNFGSTNSEEVYAITCNLNDVFISAYMTPGTSLTVGSYTLNQTSSCEPVFIVKCDANANLSYATSLNGGGDDICPIAVDSYNHLYVSGDFDHCANPFVVGTTSLSIPDGEQLFLSKLTFTNTTGTKSLSETNKYTNTINVYPNPIESEVLIKVESPSVISIINMEGKIIQSVNMQPGVNHIVLSELPSGIYIMEFSINEMHYRGKVVKMK